MMILTGANVSVICPHLCESVLKSVTNAAVRISCNELSEILPL